MANNVTLNPGSGGSVMATNDVGGVQYQVEKIGLGNSGVFDGTVSSTNPMPTVFQAARYDAFGRIRMASPQVLLDSKLVNDSHGLFWDDQQVSGSGTASTYNINRSSVSLSVNNATAGSRVRQSKMRANYQPGKSQLVFATFVLGSAFPGITRRVGYFDGNNGIFLELAGTIKAFVIRTNISGSPSDTNRVTQPNWNLDKLDGSGPSGKTLDLTKAQIMIIDFEWLGVGSVRCGFVIDGIIIYCTSFFNANLNAGVYMTSPNLPIRYEITNDGTGFAATLECICSQVSSEGGQEATGFIRAIDRGAVSMQTLNTADLFPIVAIRFKSTHLGSVLHITDVSTFSTTNASYRWAVILNPTVVGTALNFADIPNSCLQADQAATNATTFTGGTVLFSGYSNANVQGAISTSYVNTSLGMGSAINGTSDFVVLAVQRLTATTVIFYGGITVREMY